MRYKSTRIKKLVVKAMNMLKHARIPRFSSKFSPRIYTQHQHFLILVLKKYFRASYRDIVEILEEMTRIRELVRLERIPHYTTPQKFFDRIKPFEWPFEVWEYFTKVNECPCKGDGRHHH